MSALQTQPTAEQFSAYRLMFDHFNGVLFDGLLPPVILNFSRHSGAFGFFAPERWKRIEAEATIHEISLNPSYLGTRPARETASTLVHEMCHLWQEVYGSPPRRGYHDREWSTQMVSVGLQPICPKTGADKMSAAALTHRMVDGGPFSAAFERLPTTALLPWTCAEISLRGSRPRGPAGGIGPEGDEPPKTRNKAKFTCPDCGINAWGKPSLRLTCIDGHAPVILILAE